MKKNVSIIIPVYNAEKYLTRTVESVLASCYADFELLLVNDASRDRSEHICQKFTKTDSRVKLISKNTQQGPSAARNTGLLHAQGDYIMFVDSDDTIDSLLLGALVDSIGDADLSIAGLKYLNSEGVNIRCSYNPHFTEKPIEDFVNHELLNMCKNCSIYGPVNKLFRRTIIERYRIRFDEIMTILEDSKFVLDYLSHCHTISSASDVYYNYFQNPSSLMTRFAPLANYSLIEYWKSIQCLFKSIYSTADDVRVFFHRQVSQYALSYVEYIYIRSRYTNIKKYKTLCNYISSGDLIQIASLGKYADCSLFKKIIRYLLLKSNKDAYRITLHILFTMKHIGCSNCSFFRAYTNSIKILKKLFV